MKVTIRPKALWDLDEIAEQIGRSSPQAALRFLDAFDETAQWLALFPDSGSQYETTDPRLADIRIWHTKGFRNHLIFFRRAEAGIEILRVLYGARDYESIMQAPGE